MKRTLSLTLTISMLAAFSLASCDRHDDNTTVIHDTVYITPGTETPAGAFDQYGASKSTFSVGEGVSVRFSRGNLQYQASTGTWRFAEHQFDYLATANNNISSTYSGWIDLFAWGTSGWNSGANCYQPWSTSGTDSDYYPGGSYTNSLTGQYANADWGVYNAISNGGNKTGLWRTLSRDEWTYLFYTRTDASSKYATARIEQIPGIVILPDVWTLPTGLLFTPGMNGYYSNTYTVDQWTRMEEAGAIFLPAAGRNDGYAGMFGYYWSSTYNDEISASDMDYSEVELGSLVQGYERHFRQSVRLVKTK